MEKSKSRIRLGYGALQEIIFFFLVPLALAIRSAIQQLAVAAADDGDVLIEVQPIGRGVPPPPPLPVACPTSTG